MALKEFIRLFSKGRIEGKIIGSQSARRGHTDELIFQQRQKQQLIRIGDGLFEVVRRQKIFPLSAIDEGVAGREEGRMGGVGFDKFDFGVRDARRRLAQYVTVANLIRVVSFFWKPPRHQDIKVRNTF